MSKFDNAWGRKYYEHVSEHYRPLQFALLLILSYHGHYCNDDDDEYANTRISASYYNNNNNNNNNIYPHSNLYLI